MTLQKLQHMALSEWESSPKLQAQYHTFDHYWREKYVRVYNLGLPGRLGAYVRHAAGVAA